MDQLEFKAYNTKANIEKKKKKTKMNEIFDITKANVKKINKKYKK